MKTEPERITIKKIGNQILEQLNLERGLGYTIKQFIVRPGRAVQEFLYEDRSLYVKPFSFLLLTTGLATFLMLELMIKHSPDMSALTDSKEWQTIPQFLKPGVQLIILLYRKYFNLLYLLMLPMTSLAAYWLLRKKYTFNFAEILVINAYIFSIQSLFYLIRIGLLLGTTSGFWLIFSSVLTAGYFIYAYRQIFELSFWRATLYSAAIYLMAQVFNLLIFGIVVLVAAAF